MTDVYVCKESGAFEYDGDMVVVNKGVTRVRSGHPILAAHPELFEEITVHYDVEQATAAPGEKRSVKVPAVESADKDAREIEALRAEAEKAGVTVDKRWGPDRLKQEIADASKGKK